MGVIFSFPLDTLKHTILYSLKRKRTTCLGVSAEGGVDKEQLSSEGGHQQQGVEGDLEDLLRGHQFETGPEPEAGTASRRERSSQTSFEG